jgi:hypothetical protein
MHDDSLKSFVDLFNEPTVRVKLAVKSVMKGKEMLISHGKRNRKSLVDQLA